MSQGATWTAKNDGGRRGSLHYLDVHWLHQKPMDWPFVQGAKSLSDDSRWVKRLRKSRIKAMVLYFTKQTGLLISVHCSVKAVSMNWDYKRMRVKGAWQRWSQTAGFTLSEEAPGYKQCSSWTKTSQTPTEQSSAQQILLNFSVWNTLGDVVCWVHLDSSFPCVALFCDPTTLKKWQTPTTFESSSYIKQ